MREIGTEHWLSASPDTVWRTLAGFPEYRHWNPFVTQAAGTTRAGNHYFLPEADSADTRLLHGARFSSLLVPARWRAVETRTRSGLESMNSALAARIRNAG